MAARRVGGFIVGVLVALASVVGTAGAEEPPDTTPPVVGLELVRTRFSPNGDGNADIAPITVRLDEPATVTVIIRRAGVDLRTLALDRATGPGPFRVDWRGLDDAHHEVSDGRVTVLATATDAAGNAASATAALTVDTTAPTFTWISVPSQPLTTSDPLHVRFRTAGESGRVTVSLGATSAYGANAAPRRTLNVQPGTHRVPWTLVDRHGHLVTPGLYRIHATATDDVGNKRHGSERVIRIHRPVTTEVLRQLSAAGGRVALTFDDCNDGNAWSRILDVLISHLSGGSFFCIGNNVRRFPSRARRTAAAGFTIGSHSPDHERMVGLGAREVARRLRLDEQTWWDVAHTTPAPFFRPPYGDQDLDVRRGAGFTGFRWTVLWDVDPRDWERPGATQIANRVLKATSGGSIVVMHALPQTADALPAILDGLHDRGLRAVGLAQLVRAAGRR